MIIAKLSYLKINKRATTIQAKKLHDIDLILKILIIHRSVKNIKKIVENRQIPLPKTFPCSNDQQCFSN